MKIKIKECVETVNHSEICEGELMIDCQNDPCLKVSYEAIATMMRNMDENDSGFVYITIGAGERTKDEFWYEDEANDLPGNCKRVKSITVKV